MGKIKDELKKKVSVDAEENEECCSQCGAPLSAEEVEHLGDVCFCCYPAFIEAKYPMMAKMEKGFKQ